MNVIIWNQIYCTEWSLQISIAPSTIQHFPNANETEFHIEINSKSFIVGSNHTLLFTTQGQTSAGQKVRGRPHRRVDETVERGRVSGEGRAGRGKADTEKKYYTYYTLAIVLQVLVYSIVRLSRHFYGIHSYAHTPLYVMTFIYS